MKTTSIYTFAWFAAAAVALALASASPTESRVMGKLPSLTSKRLDQAVVYLPADLPAGRTLALVAFNRSQRDEIESWIQGLNLHQDSSIAWVSMPVLQDPGTELARTHKENRMQERHVQSPYRERILPVFTNREAFLRSTGMSSADHAWVLVIDRDGQVLAKVEGQFNQAKAEALRETLLATDNSVF